MRILSLKGGGIRGLLSARIGQRLNQAVPNWHQQADLIAGTSTGGLIALALAADLPWETIVDLYYGKATQIFADNFFDNLADLNISGVSFRGAQYGSDGLEAALEDLFGDMRLGDLHHKVLVPAFDLTRWYAKFFDSEADADVRVVDVAMATASAPLTFPLHKGKWVDGGVIANDPTMCALAHVLNKNNGYVVDAVAALMTDPPAVLTLGTGTAPGGVDSTLLIDNDWGLLDWSPWLKDVVLDGGMLAPVYQATQILGGRFHYLNPALPREIKMDGDAYRGQDVLKRNLQELMEIADAAPLQGGPMKGPPVDTTVWLRTVWGTPQPA